MTRSIKYQAWLILIFIWGSFWGWAPLTNADVVFEIVNGLYMAVGGGVAVVAFPGAMECMRFRVRDMHGGHFLVLGIFIVGMSSAFAGTWRWVYRVLDRPEWMTDNLLSAFPSFMAFTGFILLMIAADTIAVRTVPQPNWLRLGVVFAVSGGLVMTLMLLVGGSL